VDLAHHKNLAGASRLSFYQAKSYRGVLNQGKNVESTPLCQVLRRLKAFKPAWIVDAKPGEHEVLLENNKGERIGFAFSNGQ
jgi:hypothetical protein